MRNVYSKESQGTCQTRGGWDFQDGERGHAVLKAWSRNGRQHYLEKTLTANRPSCRLFQGKSGWHTDSQGGGCIRESENPCVEKNRALPWWLTTPGSPPEGGIRSGLSQNHFYIGGSLEPTYLAYSNSTSLGQGLTPTCLTSSILLLVHGLYCWTVRPQTGIQPGQAERGRREQTESACCGGRRWEWGMCEGRVRRHRLTAALTFPGSHEHRVEKGKPLLVF